jgi:hypothetical protein
MSFHQTQSRNHFNKNGSQSYNNMYQQKPKTGFNQTKPKPIQTQIKEAVNNHVDYLVLHQKQTPSSIGVVQIQQMVSKLVSELEAKSNKISQRERDLILAEILGRIINHLPGTRGMNHGDYVMSLGELIRHTINTKCYGGYSLADLASWSYAGKVNMTERIIKEDEDRKNFIGIYKSLADLGVNFFEENAQKENSFDSYKEACLNKKAPEIDEVSQILKSGGSGDVRKNIISLMNRIIPINNGKTDSFIRYTKYSSKFRIVYSIDPQTVVNEFINNQLGNYQYSKKGGFHERVHLYIALMDDVLSIPKKDITHTSFFQLLNKTAFEMNLDDCDSSLICPDVIGAIIGSLGENYNKFISKQMAILESIESSTSSTVSDDDSNRRNDLAQNQIMTATVHLVKSFGKNWIRFASPETINKLVKISPSLHKRIRFSIEEAVREAYNLVNVIPIAMFGSLEQLAQSAPKLPAKSKGVVLPIRKNGSTTNKNPKTMGQKNMFDLLNMDGDEVEAEVEDKVGEKAEAEEKDEDMIQYLVSDVYQTSYCPKFLREFNSPNLKKTESGWNDQMVDDWMYHMELSIKNFDSDEKQILIRSIILSAINNGFTQSDRMIPVNCLKRLLVELFGEIEPAILKMNQLLENQDIFELPCGKNDLKLFF